MEPILRIPLEKALSGAAFGFALFDAQDRLREANPWFEEAYHVKAGESPSWEAMMRSCHADRRGVLIDTEDIDAWLGQVRTRYRQVPVRAFQSDLCDGRWVWVVETLLADGWLSMAVSDVSPLKAAESALQSARDEAVRMSQKDPLTDLHNRRYIMNHLAKTLGGAQAMRWPLTLVMLDIDHFKQINDTEGHAVGDAVLCHFAQLLKEHLRPLDAVGRIGGEEFLLVLANTGLEGAARMLQRMRELVVESMSSAGLPIPGYTFSAGIALARAQDSVDSLFRRADHALYRAKRLGRDRDEVADSRSMRL